jgi:hypothetical protein
VKTSGAKALAEKNGFIAALKALRRPRAKFFPQASREGLMKFAKANSRFPDSANRL